MQRYTKNNTDERTFQQIWNDITPAERGLLKSNLIEKLRCSRQTIENWGKGLSPINKGFRQETERVIKKTFGFKVHYISLFPNAR